MGWSSGARTEQAPCMGWTGLGTSPDPGSKQHRGHPWTAVSMHERSLCQPQPWHREGVHLPAGSPGPVWDRVSPGSPCQAVSCRRFEHKAMAVAQIKVTALEQALPSLLDPSQAWGCQSLGSAVPQGMVQPCCPQGDDESRKIQPLSPRLFKEGECECSG